MTTAAGFFIGAALFALGYRLATQAGAQTQSAPSLELFDGALIVPPGGVLALLCSLTPVGHSAASGLVWEEVPI